MVRREDEATLAERTDLLLGIEDLDLSAEVAVGILSLSDEEWQGVVREAPLALDRVMRDEIRESNLPLIVRRVPMLISDTLSQPATEVAIPLVQHLIRPNSTINEERTSELRSAARAAGAAPAGNTGARRDHHPRRATWQLQRRPRLCVK